jgi:hypothetical protein
MKEELIMNTPPIITAINRQDLNNTLEALAHSVKLNKQIQTHVGKFSITSEYSETDEAAIETSPNKACHRNGAL